MGRFLRRLRALFHRREMERQLAEEMSAHCEMMPSDRRANFGSTLRLREEAADQWGFTWLDHFRQDLAYGARSLRRSPGFALTAIAVLSLGIGVNLAEAHIFNAVLHRLHVRDVDSLRRFYRMGRQRRADTFSLPQVEFYRAENTVLSAVIAETDVAGIYLAQDAKDLHCALVSGNFFGELGVRPLYGRLLNEEDDRAGAPAVAVLSYDYWQNRFGGDPGLVMQTVRLNDKPVQVVGIAQSEFAGLARQTNVWMAAPQYRYLTADRRLLEDYRTAQTALFGRLKPGISSEAAEAQFRVLTAELRRQQPRSVEAGEWLQIAPAEVPPGNAPAKVMMVTTFILLVLLVLFSACANLGNMLLARGLARQREIEIRLAVGAGRWRLVRQLMTENLLLAAIASIAALFVGSVAARLLLRIIAAPSDLRIVTDWRIVAACAALAVGATLAFGLAPALQIAARGPRATRSRKVLVSVQVAASCVLLILSSFFTRAMQKSLHTESGFDYSGMALVDPVFYLHNYTPAQARQTALEMAARLRQLPGIDAATIATGTPIGFARVARASGPPLYLNQVDPSYFPMMHLGLMEGRIFGPEDEDAVVISASAAHKLWPNRSPLGRMLFLGQRNRTVAGVVKDSGANLADTPESVEVYLPIGDQSARLVSILVHTKNSVTAMAAAIRSTATIPGIVPVVLTLQSLVDERLEAARKVFTVVGALAAVASSLAVLGIFGLLAFTVAQRTREIGVRMALGADSRDILRVVLGQYAFPFGIGAVAGMAVAAAAAQVMRSLLFGFMPFELLSFAAGLVLFAAVAIAASVVPARRALRIDPCSALRYE